MPLLAKAENSIQAVSGSVQGGSEVIRIELTEPLTSVPTGFSIQAPARIALDFQGVSNSLGRSAIEINLGNMRSANVIQAGERTRVVLNLKTPTAYKAELQGKSLLIILDSQAIAAPSMAAAPVFAESRNRDTLPLKDIDFRRGPDNSGRIVVALPNNEVGVDIRQQGKTVVVEFLKTALPEGLRRRLDVTDFGTPVQTVTTSQVGDKVRMVVEPTGQWEQSAYQSDNQFVLEVRPQKIDPDKLTQGTGFNGEKLSLNFQNIEIRSLLQVIADFTNFNVVTSDTVTGSVTLRLKDVPWDQALDIILQAKGLGMRKTGNVLLIAPKDELAAKDKQELESRVAIQSLEAVRTQSFQINYAKASEIAVQISAGGVGAGTARILSSRGSVIAEPRTNQLFVTDIPSRLEQVQSLIGKLDIAVRQVLIEARIVEASDTFGRSLGVRLGGGMIGAAGALSNGNTNVTLGTNYNATAADTSGNFVSFPASTLGVANNAASFAVSIFNAAANRFLNLELSALEADGKGKIVSSPRVVTADQVKALIEQGTEFPYQTATSSGATSLAFRKANLKLEVTPQITPEGNIILDLDVNKDSRGETTAAGIAIDTKHIKTQVLVENGGTVVIGGIFTLEETNNETKVPLLGDVPYLGNLFKSRERTSRKQEMLVFITPKMITDRAAAR
ncbi:MULTISPECIES: type IV pilus secretin PilQ [unclassified Polaromonas]|uniref:type IV pilus secretin PilQ n=1 Tax=unclassified Polaromonas TaxID=2638319 RepID=UPI001A31EB9F|nr:MULTISPECIES: type IV pilus secretin PilQ [unclassified Polaromonas]MBG6071870.1 type IV pilus assembly protein PilQ [Polaromonas sp. CG_9.7]MBG6113871.1 type IV pilus assembly protein PilQ [Polaromonas sp. CG_9.2]MDH6183788.1 type IV pilus assembly protein PilQ [Polaromonas sp. CG_23.6]